MKMNKRITTAVSLVLTTLLLAACGGGGGGGGGAAAPPAGGGAAAADPIVLRLGHVQSEADIWHIASERFAEEVERLSDGEMTVDIFPNSILVGDRDMGEGLQMGTVDIALIAGVLGVFEPTILILELPYLFESQEEFDRIIHGDVGAEIANNVLESSSIRILNWWNRGSRQVTSNRPINGLADLQSLVIRVPEITAMVQTWNVMGASPTPMAWAEVFTGLEQGVIEAQENPIPFIYSASLFEVQDYLAFTNHKYEYVTMSMSEIRWQSLTPEQQDIVMEAARIASQFQNEQVVILEQELLESMISRGVTVTNPNIDEISAQARTAHRPFAETVDIDLFDRIMAELGR